MALPICLLEGTGESEIFEDCWFIWQFCGVLDYFGFGFVFKEAK